MDYFSGLQFPMSGILPEYRQNRRNEPLYYSIQFNYQGKLYLRTNERNEFHVEGPYAFLTYPGTLFEYRADGESSSRYHCFICSCGPRIQKYIDSGLWPQNPASPLIKVRNPERFLQSMQTLDGMIRNPGLTPARAVLLFEDLLLQLHESEGEERKLSVWRSPVILSLMDEIRLHPEKDWVFEKEAEAMNITLIHFRRLFKNESGLSPVQFLQQIRLQKAALELIHSEDPVSLIAERCGIGNPYYFSRLFKETYRISPQEYRREVKGTLRQQDGSPA